MHLLKSEQILTHARTWEINDLAIDSQDCIFVAGNHGLFRSYDDGESWTKIYPYHVNCISVLDSKMFVGLPRGLMYSNDKGETGGEVDRWNHQGLQLQSKQFTTMSDSKEIVFAGTMLGSGELFCSEDKGKNWRRSTIGDSGIFIVTKVLIADKIVFAGTNHGIFRSIDLGRSWQHVNGSMHPYYGYFVSGLVINKRGVLFAGGSGRYYLHRSLNGTDWKKFIRMDVLSLLIDNKQNIFVGTPGQIFISKDEGLTFRAISLSDLPEVLAMNSKGCLYIGTRNDGLYRCQI